MRSLACVLCMIVAQVQCDPWNTDPLDPTDPSTPWNGGINGGDAAEPVPEIGEPVSLQIISRSTVDADMVVQFGIGDMQARLTELRVPAGSRANLIGPDRAVIVRVDGRYATNRPTPSKAFQLGKDFIADDIIEFIIPDPDDDCPDDPNKDAPGICGCGMPDDDTDGDGTADCIDLCPGDPQKTDPGVCGCGISDADSDGDSVLDCKDGCPNDADKTEPGECGCGKPDADSDGDGALDCKEDCPDDPTKTTVEQCGCGKPDTDTDGDLTADCVDGCPTDPKKTAPGICGCNVSDADANGNGTVDCKETPPPPPAAKQACCLSGGACIDVVAAQCSGQAMGSGTTCETVSCPQPVEACCSPDGSCQEMDPVDCSTGGGVPQGVGTDCDTTVCPQPQQACCTPDGQCADLAPAECTAQGGVPPAGDVCLGDGDQNGVDDACETPTQPEACCVPDSSCIEVTPETCTAMDGVPQGPGSTCEHPDCPQLRIYWTEHLDGVSRIASVLADGTDMRTHVTMQGGPFVDVDFDINTLHICWTSGFMPTIWTAVWDGWPVQVVHSASSYATAGGIAYDLMNGAVVWTETDAYGYYVAVKGYQPPSPPEYAVFSGPGVDAGPITTALLVPGVAVWSHVDDDSVPRLYAAILGGPGQNDVIPLPIDLPDDLDVPPAVTMDLLNAHPDVVGVLYWTEEVWPDATIQAIFLSEVKDSAVTVSTFADYQPIALSEGYPGRDVANLAFDPFAAKIYWTMPRQGKIMRANWDGTGVEEFITELQSVTGIAVAPIPRGG